MAAGKKTGGRKKGTPNKDKAELLELIRQRVGDQDYHPVVEMAALACDENLGLELRANMHKEVARYVAPTLKSVEHKGGDDVKGLNFFMGFTEERQVSRPEAGNGEDKGNGAQRPRPRAGQ